MTVNRLLRKHMGKGVNTILYEWKYKYWIKVKTLWPKEKLLIINNFSYCHNVSQILQNVSASGKGTLCHQHNLHSSNNWENEKGNRQFMSPPKVKTAVCQKTSTHVFTSEITHTLIALAQLSTLIHLTLFRI